MIFHLFEFPGFKTSGLSKDGIVYGDLAYVMHRGGLDQVGAEGFVDPVRKSTCFPDDVDQDSNSFAGAADMPAGPVPIIAISYRSVFLASFISLMYLYFIKYIYSVNTFDKIF